jgi:acyl carrier protein
LNYAPASSTFHTIARDIVFRTRAWNRRKEITMTTARPSLSREELHHLLWDLTAEYSDRERSELTPHTRLNQDLGADSLTVTELTMALEERLELTMPDELLANQELTLGQIEEALWERSQSGETRGR